MSKNVRWITETAVMLALLIALQALTKPLGQLVTGSCVNAVLAVSVLLAGLGSGITIAVISPVLAFLLGIAPQLVTVPAIMVGNTVFVVLLYFIAGKSSAIPQRIAAWLVAAVAKFATLYILVVKIICGTRSYREQDKLYQQGRTLPGTIVTKAKSGYSNHNFGIAFDLGVFVNGKYEEGDKLYRKLHADCGCPDGFLWGGDWRSMPDTPHYQLARFGDTTEKIRKVFIA